MGQQIVGADPLGLISGLGVMWLGWFLIRCGVRDFQGTGYAPGRDASDALPLRGRWLELARGLVAGIIVFCFGSVLLLGSIIVARF